MTVLNRCAACVFLACATVPTLIAAQESSEAPAAGTAAPAAAPRALTVGQLLERGYDVVSMSYEAGSFLLILQSGPRAFLCESNIQGATKACVALK